VSEPTAFEVPEPGTTLTGADWSGLTLDASVVVQDVTFVDCDLRELVTNGATFDGCTFRAVELNASEHIDTAFTRCRFHRSVLFGATFRGCKLVGSVFEGCEWPAVEVEGGNWSFVGLRKADLRKVTITGARLREADLSEAFCTDATLRELDLSGAVLHGADLRRADLRGSDLSSLDPTSTRLDGAVVTVDQSIAIAQSLGLDVRPG
jgi:fluoroquinolone resistance protein